MARTALALALAGVLGDVRAAAPSCSEYAMLNGTCLPGGTLRAVAGSTPAECCAACTAAAPQCTHWTLDTERLPKACNIKSGAVDTQRLSPTCTSGMPPGPPPPPPTPPPPPIPPPAPPNPDALRPHILFVLADDLGFFDTAVYNPNSPTPTIAMLAQEGVRLDHHYVFRYCSPTRRSFLSGRFPNLITTVQPDGAQMCSDFLPLAFTTLPEKLATAGYKSHHVGKGHEGYQTVDHLPINRGFDSHVGYLSGGKLTYSYGMGSPQPLVGTHDMWHMEHPGWDVVPEIFYSANFYASQVTSIVEAHDPKDPLFVYFPIQNVHAPYQLPPDWETRQFPAMWSNTYANMLHLLDGAVKNATDAFKAKRLWENTLMVFTADNGGIGLGNNYPLRGHKHDPFEGGTRSTAFIAGGVVPTAVRGKPSGAKLVHIADWYATFCGLAGVDPRDTVYMGGTARDINSVDVWPLLAGRNATQPRALTPTTEAGIIEVASPTQWWKLITLAGQSNYYNPENQSAIPGSDPCLAGRQPDPSQPKGRTDPLVNGLCPICNSSKPCLYDLLDDPSERRNVALSYPDVVARLAPPLAASNLHYVTGTLPADQLVANYSELANRTVTWRGYAGPCYIRKNKTSTVG